MPRVGKKHFPYTKKGRAQAKAYAKRTGKKVSHKKAVVRSRPKTLADVYNRLL